MAVPAKKIETKIIGKSDNEHSVIEKIQDRQTAELIIGLCGSVGSGTSTIADKLKEIFVEYEYTVEKIKISTLIKAHRNRIKNELDKDLFLKNEYISRIDLNDDIENMDFGDRIALLQSAGNALRANETPDILAQLAINEIAIRRKTEDFLEENSEVTNNDNVETRKPK